MAASGDSYDANDQARGARRELTDVAKLSVYFNHQNTEKNQFYTNISKKRGHKADLTDHLKCLQMV